MKIINEKRNYCFEEIEQNKFLSKKHKKVCTTLNDIEHLLTLASAINGCISIPAFAFLIVNPVGITSSAIRLKICAKTTGIKRVNNGEKEKET